jgi:hypothetical protein
MVDAQVEVPPKAGLRKGIQPVVELKVNGGVRAEVAVGQPVTLSAMIEVPPNTGKVVAVEWDFDGAGGYVPVGARRYQPICEREGHSCLLAARHLLPCAAYRLTT